MSKLMAECNRCGKELEYAGMGNITHVTIERFTASRMSADRRNLCPECADKLIEWFENCPGKDDDIPMGG